MSGILNQKTRILDVILTDIGKKQLAEGELQAEFYSFSDGSAIYKRDTIISGGLTETHRFVLEACNSPYDQITFDAGDEGLVTAFPISGSERYAVVNGRLFSGSIDGQKVPVTGSQFASTLSNLLSGSIDAFKNQFILKSPDPIDDRQKSFTIGNNNMSFEVTNTSPYNESEARESSIEHVESFFQDKRLSHVPNFQFLPPVNPPDPGEDEGSLLGNYIDIRQNPISNYEDLMDDLSRFTSIGYTKDVEFMETSEDNNILAQFFEISTDQIKKLEIIDFGSFVDDEEGIEKQVFFAGKVIVD